MDNPKEPTNADLYERLGRMEASTSERLDSILEQVKKTNGRVTRLEKWKERLDIIEVYKKENGAIIVPKEVDWQKLMLYSLGLVGTALAVISYRHSP
jgi:hypothetical protein